MVTTSVKQIVFSQQDLQTLFIIIELSFEAFQAAEFPRYYLRFLEAVMQLIDLGSIAVVQAGPNVDSYRFSTEVDNLWGTLSEIKCLLNKESTG